MKTILNIIIGVLIVVVVVISLGLLSVEGDKTQEERDQQRSIIIQQRFDDCIESGSSYEVCSCISRNPSNSYKDCFTP